VNHRIDMKQHQRGGTIIGFIIGVVVGLGVALAVAVYVTKVPIPFVNKNQPVTPEQDAAEARRNRDWDPNAPLGGRPRPATTPSTPAAAASAPAAPGAALPPAVSGGPGTAPSAPPAASADPLGDLAKARASGADPFRYFVQAGAFRTSDDAESQRARISLMGVEAQVTERDQAGRTVYRVRTGPFERKEDADRMKERLEGNGLEAALVRVQR
jgi:cell division protein FtsN